MPTQLRKETDERLRRAKAWLQTAEPRDTEDLTFRLFGLHWAGAPGVECRRAANGLLALQRPGGGWSELPHMQPDAYSTGEALVALHQAGGVPITDRGSWHVRTRMLSPAGVSPPYFETGFPYGHDQFLSTDGTCWASMALMLALPKTSTPAVPLPLPKLAPTGLKPWMDTAMFGTPAELKALLDGGLDPGTKTPDGTTLLMMVAPDAGKMKLLIDRGADVRSKAKSGFTALMVTTTYFGTSEAVKLLLTHGAEARLGTGVMFNASPLFLAALSGDGENIALLAAKGADPRRSMSIIGMFPTSPLVQAVEQGDPRVVHAVVAAGADIHEKDADGMTALHWAVLAHRSDAVQALLAAGADVNAVDRFGYTPLLYASTVDFGDAATAEALLRAGADPNIPNKEGKTPLVQAREYPYIRAALEKVVTR